MSRKGLLFGMTQPMGYWLILVALMTLATVPLAIWFGRFFARASTRARKILGCLFCTGISSLLWNCLICFGMSALVPQHAFGHSYDVAIGLFAVLVLHALGAVTISLIAAGRAGTATPVAP